MKQKGDAFELDVREMLALQGWTVTNERLLGHKKVDALASKTTEFGQFTRMAVECKDYLTPLTKTTVVGVVADYLPLLSDGRVDALLLITRHGLAPAAGEYADGVRGLIHCTYPDLLRSLIDFSSYVPGLVTEYETDLIATTYTEQCYADSDGTRRCTLERDLLEWVDADDPMPIAVVAGYGMGKTTLARRMAFILGRRYLADPQARIPVLIGLEQVSSDQSLEGLLGRHFTSLHNIPRYNFHAFSRLNAAGRFVLLLDGFDEMRRLMSPEVLHYNLSQLARLVVGNSKVVLFGRLTVFMSDEEQLQMLHGMGPLGGAWRRLPGTVGFRELHLLPFSEGQIEAFLTRFASVSKKNARVARRVLFGRSPALKRASQTALLTDIATRPVQLKMLTEVLPSYHGPIDDLTLTVLYSEFIDLVIRRECSKLTRQAVPPHERRAFAADLAVWMWRKALNYGVAAADLPDELFSLYSRPGEDLLSTRRDLLAACFLERKVGTGYYFPHRSFQEFLIAEFLSKSIVSKTLIPDMGFLTAEIRAFVATMVSRRDVVLWLAAVYAADDALPDATFDLMYSLAGHFNVPFGPSAARRLQGRVSSWGQRTLIPLMTRSGDAGEEGAQDGAPHPPDRMQSGRRGRRS